MSVTDNSASRRYVDSEVAEVLSEAATDAQAFVTTHNTSNGAHGIFFGETLPSGTTIEQWSVPQTQVLVGPNGKVWFREADGTAVPNDPPPVVSTIAERLDLAVQHHDAAYVTSGGVVVASGATASYAVASALGMAVLRRDKALFDLILDWSIANLRRGKSGSGQSTFLEGWASTASDAGVVSSWTVHAGAELQVMKWLIRAWNLWGEVNYKDIGSRKAALIKSLVTMDEGRAYLRHTEATPHTYNGSQWIHCCPSDYDFVALKLGHIFTGDNVFLQIIDAGYDLWNKSTVNSGPLATTTGLPPENLCYNPPTHGVSAIVNGVNGWGQTLTTNYTTTAGEAVSHLRAHKDVYNESRATNLLTGAMKTWFAAHPTLYSEYTHTGTAVGSTELVRPYWRAIQSLTANEPNNTVATTMRSTKLPTDMASDGNGRYFADQIQGATASSTRDADASIYYCYSIDSQLYLDVAKLGSNPSAGTTNPGSTPVDPPVVVPPPANENPVQGLYKLHYDNSSACYQWYQSIDGNTYPGKKSRAKWAAELPQAYWTSINWDGDCHGVETYINAMNAVGAVSFILSYSIPLRDLGQYSAGGASNDTEYRNWITLLATKIGTKRVAMVYEPDSLTHATELNQTQRAGRMANMRWGMAYLRANCPNLWLYVDAGHPYWKSVQEISGLLQEVGVEIATGFALNVSNFVPFDANIAYAQSIRAIVGNNAHFTIDCARNGNPNNAPHWANPARRRIGKVPQWGGFDDIPGLDGVTIWKRIGESDGNSGDGAPSAGNFWPTYLYNDSVGDNVNTDQVSTSSGMLQRPPTPGVAIAAPV